MNKIAVNYITGPGISWNNFLEFLSKILIEKIFAISDWAGANQREFQRRLAA